MEISLKKSSHLERFFCDGFNGTKSPFRFGCQTMLPAMWPLCQLGWWQNPKPSTPAVWTSSSARRAAKKTLNPRP